MNDYVFAYDLISDEVLQHYGTPRHSGRYPWGSGKNPYHHGNSSPFAKIKERRAEKKRAKVRAQSLEKARQARTAKAEYERNKAAAIKSGSALAIAPYIKDLSESQLNDIKRRIQLESEFRQLAVKERSEIDPKVASTMAKLEKATKYVNTGIDAYNAAAKVYNAFSSERELPLIGSKSRKDIAAKNKTNAEVQATLSAKRRKEEAAARTETIGANKAQYEFDRQQKQDKRADKAAKKAAKAKKNTNDGSGTTKQDAKSFVEEVKDIEVVSRPVETNAERLIESRYSYLLDDKRKKK